MYTRLRFYTLLPVAVVFLLTQSSCNFFHPSGPVPAYIQITGVSVSSASGGGSSSSKITNAWVYANDQDLGVYPVPHSFPVISSGPTSLVINAGIEDNGISATRNIYPFYFPDTLTLNLEGGKVYSMAPVFRYRTNAIFAYLEDFEMSNIFTKRSGDTTLVVDHDPADVFEGLSCGEITLDAQHPSSEVETIAPVAISTAASNNVYLELNYQCDQPFQVGLLARNGTAYISDYSWNINTKGSWNKIYLNMSGDVNTLNGDDYRVLIRAAYDGVHPVSHILIDNVKLIHF